MPENQSNLAFSFDGYINFEILFQFEIMKELIIRKVNAEKVILNYHLFSISIYMYNSLLFPYTI